MSAGELVAALAAVAGPDGVRPAGPGDAVCGVRPALVVSPRSEEAVAGVLGVADERGLAVAPRGGGTKGGWGAPPARVELLLSTDRLSSVREHAWGDLTVTVEAGCTVASLQAALAGAGQRLAADPVRPEAATVGGVLATNDTGALRLRYGTLRDLVLGVTVALADGTLARSGGRVVKNVAGYDLPKLLTGSYGTLGVVTSATFRLHPLPAATADVTLETAGAVEANELAQRVVDSQLSASCVQVRASSGTRPFVDVRFEGTAPEPRAAAVAALGSRAATPAAAWRWRERLLAASGPAVALRAGVVPTEIGRFAAAVAEAGERLGFEWTIVAQADGAAALGLAGVGAGTVGPALEALREAARGGWVAVAACPDELRPDADAWGPPVPGLSLMRRVKEQFDPRGIMNPGRFMGGI